MKRFLYSLVLLAVASSATAAGSGKLPSFLNKKNNTAVTAVKKNTATAKKNTAAVAKNADAIYESVRQQYAQGKISADSVVNLALYHKVWNRGLAERCLSLVANDRNPRAETELGVLYAFSPNDKSRVNDGLKLLQAAAQAGYNQANGYLGYYYFQNKDYTRAKSYFDALHPMSQGIEYAALGSMYLEGNGVPADGAKARDSYLKSAMLGLPRGMALYASLLGTNNGGNFNYPDAFFWHYLAGELGDNYSRVMLYRPRVPEAAASDEVGQDAQQALTWIETVHKGTKLQNEPIYKEGFLKGLKAREQAAERGDDWSRFYLAGMNYNGDFLNQNYAQAMRYYEPIAKNGKLPRPMLALVHERLAEMYRDGKGTGVNAAEAARHSRIAAQYGSLPSYIIVENIQY